MVTDQAIRNVTTAKRSLSGSTGRQNPVLRVGIVESCCVDAGVSVSFCRVLRNKATSIYSKLMVQATRKVSGVPTASNRAHGWAMEVDDEAAMWQQRAWLLRLVIGCVVCVFYTLYWEQRMQALICSLNRQALSFWNCRAGRHSLEPIPLRAQSRPMMRSISPRSSAISCMFR